MSGGYGRYLILLVGLLLVISASSRCADAQAGAVAEDIDPGLAAIDARRAQRISEQSAGRDISGKLLLTGGVNNIEGTGGGGLSPWAFIGGYGTSDQIGGNGFYTRILLPDYTVESLGVLIGVFDRLELSFAQQRFDTMKIGQTLGLGQSFVFTQNTAGLKLRLLGNGVLDQDSYIPQLTLGAMFKSNDRGDVLKAVGARHDLGVDLYLVATKLFLRTSVLASGTLMMTKANQFGLLGFGGDRSDHYQIKPQFSLAYLPDPHWAIGGEYRSKPNNLSFAREENAFDFFIAWAPVKNLSVTCAVADLGTIARQAGQRGFYGSLQIGF